MLKHVIVLLLLQPLISCARCLHSYHMDCLSPHSAAASLSDKPRPYRWV